MNYVRIFARRTAPALLTSALALAACGDSGSNTSATESSDSGDTSGSESSTTAGPGTSSTGDGPTGGESQTGGSTGSTGAPATTDVSSSDATSTSPATTTGDATTGDTTTGGVDSCQAACENISSCDPDYPLEECLQDCAPELDTPECLAALDALNKCIALVSCDELMEEPCIAEVESYFEACELDDPTTGETCEAGGVGNPDLNECEFFVECPGESFGMQCSGDKCACMYNGELGEMCQLPGVCNGDKDPYDLMMECCGFELP